MKTDMKNPERLNDSAYYTFDTALLKKRIAFLRNKLPRTVSLCYAVKANSFIIKELENSVERFEVCSPGEAEICTKLNIPSEKTVISGVYKTPGAIEKMVAEKSNSCIFTAESTGQYALLKQLSQKYFKTLPVLLRLTNDSQFGMNESDIEDIISRHNSTDGIEILGIQFFSGTQKTSLKKLAREISMLGSFISGLEERYGFKIKELEYGPGLPVAYFASDSLDENELLGGFSELLTAIDGSIKVTLELGRSIAASCGKYYTHVVDKKRNREHNYLLVDGGMHQLVYFGQYMAMKRPFLSVAGKKELPETENYTVCGSLCSMNDIIVKEALLPETEIGDTLCFENTGAYCVTEGISLFLTRELPAVYIIKENSEIICVRESRETAELNTPEYERML